MSTSSSNKTRKALVEAVRRRFPLIDNRIITVSGEPYILLNALELYEFIKVVAESGDEVSG